MSRRPEVKLDNTDREIIAAALAARAILYEVYPAPIEGDIIVMPDGTEERAAHSWTRDVQPSRKEFGCSFCLFENGAMSFSGGLQPALPNERFVFDGFADASAWMFHHGHVTAYNGVNITVSVRKWRVKED